jgi:methanogenic corrinoid protein MtbC1
MSIPPLTLQPPALPPQLPSLSTAREATRSLALSIAAVERDTGLSKDTLRVWERRYGFPQPVRDGMGERSYPVEQVAKLRIVKRLMDAGHRPGRIVGLPVFELQQLCECAGPPGAAIGTDVNACLERIHAHDVDGLRRGLGQALARHGLAHFVVDLIVPLNTSVGDAWMRGKLEVFQEHLYTEAVQSVLRRALGSLPEGATGGSRPRVLITSLSGEPHGLGLLMAEALFAVEGCPCIPLGVQTPVWDVAQAARAYRADIVALGFTGCMNPNHVLDALTELRGKLPSQVALWVGGSAPVLHRRRIDGVHALASLQDIPAALDRWKAVVP